MVKNSSLDDGQTDLLDITTASNVLGVSTATTRNWIKAGQLAYSSRGSGKLLDKKQIEQLKTDIYNGKTERLNHRANKRNSKSTFIPIEQLSHRDKLPLLQSYIEQINKHQVPLQTALLIHSLSVLKKIKLVNINYSMFFLYNLKIVKTC